MSAPKLAVYRGLLFKIESTYGDAAAVSNTADGILVCDEMVPTHPYLHSGERRPAAAPGMAGNMRRVAPSGAGQAWDIKHEMKGGAAAYSASVTPSGHRLLLAAGFDGAVTTTGGSEKWDYTPTPKGTTPSSGSAELYGRETKFPANGIYLDMAIEWDDLGVPLWTFPAVGRSGTRADSQPPVITYPTLTTEPPKATGITLNIGDFSSNIVARSGSFRLNRTIGPRRNQNASGGHAGFSPGRRNPSLELLIEATDFVSTPFHTSAGLDPHQFYEGATEVTCALQFGSTQYNRIKLIMGKVQMAGPPVEEDDEGTACWRLTLQVNPTAVNNNDDITIRTD